MAERGHGCGGGEAEAYLVDLAEPGSDIGDGLGAWELLDVVNHVWVRLDPCLCQLKTKKINLGLPELEFFRVKDTSSQGTFFYELTDPEEICLDVVVPKDGVIYTVLVVLHVAHYQVHPLCVTVSCTKQALRCCPILKSSPWGQEDGVLPICRVDGDGVVPVPVVKDGLDFPPRDGGGYVPW